MADSLRTREMAEAYKAHRENGGLDGECVLCTKPATRIFTYWKVMPNLFPYDSIASKHDMIMPIRHAIESELTTEEWEEFRTMKADFMQQYDNIIEGTHKTKSIPTHFHLHLIIGKEAQ